MFENNNNNNNSEEKINQEKQLKLNENLTITTTTTPTTYEAEEQDFNKNKLFSLLPESEYSSCSIIKLPLNTTTSVNNLYKYTNPADTTHMNLLNLQRRRWLLQRHACLFSILLAFILGMVMGVFLPMFGWVHMWQGINYAPIEMTQPQQQLALPLMAVPSTVGNQTDQPAVKERPPSDFPTIYELRSEEQQMDNAFSVAFIKEKASLYSQKLLAAKSEQIEEPQVQLNFVPLNAKSAKHINAVNTPRQLGLIKSDIYWGDEIEALLPRGFTPEDTIAWNQYLQHDAIVARLETGCGRMQNRLVIFSDGKRACARYRQNTDQIQGELFSFYLGQLLNLKNLAPSAAAVVDLNSSTWNGALADITQAQWKQQRPVVLTRWLPELEPAGIPKPFRPMERHLNKYDVWNMTLTNQTKEQQQQHDQQQESNQRGTGAELNQLIVPTKNQLLSSSLMKRMNLNERAHQSWQEIEKKSAEQLKKNLIELAQWSDLIVFDYLIANLDRVVNNLYNYQWNADIMAAPAHNLVRQTNSPLLIFLDNESGLLHGYRLLKKYEAYHGLLLDNLCVFRQPTIDALRKLRSQGVGSRLRELFESTTTSGVRDVLPSLPDKSIKILVDRIDRVLGQVQKCRDLLADR